MFSRNISLFPHCSLYLKFNFQYSITLIKYDRHGYKPRERALIVTTKHMYLLEGKNFKIKHSLPLGSILEIVVTTESDNLMLLRIPPELKKDKVRIKAT